MPRPAGLRLLQTVMNHSKNPLHRPTGRRSVVSILATALCEGRNVTIHPLDGLTVSEVPDWFRATVVPTTDPNQIDIFTLPGVRP